MRVIEAEICHCSKRPVNRDRKLFLLYNIWSHGYPVNCFARYRMVSVLLIGNVVLLIGTFIFERPGVEGFIQKTSQARIPDAFTLLAARDALDI
jgi:hypothetical protein